MQIQKGLVKYKDRNDIVCTYGITEDGSQYYFLDVDKLPNGNIIASTALVEAIDSSVVPSALGVIDADGNIVVPFANKMIKPINDNILLVERAQPMTESVLENIKLRSDPLSATKLVTIPSNIKDKLNKKMGVDGEFIFNDQFSEATICDMNGKNLVDNQYFSFIGMDKDTLYFSTNVLDSLVVSYSIPSKDSSSNEVKKQDEVQTVGQPSDLSDKKSLDVNNIDVNKTAIDEAINKEMGQLPKKDVNVSMPPLDDIFNKNSVVDENKDTNTNDSVNEVDDSVKSDNNADKSLDSIGTLNLKIDNSSESEDNKEVEDSSSNNSNNNTDSATDISQVFTDDVKENDEEIKQPLFGELISNNVDSKDDSKEEENKNSLDNNNITDDKSVSIEEQDRNDPLPLNNAINDNNISTNDKVIENYPSIKYFGDLEDDEEQEPGDSSEELLNIDIGPVVEKESSIKDSDSVISNDYDDIDLDLEMNLDTDTDSGNYTSSTDYISDYSRYSSIGGAKDSIIEDVAVTMSNLINLNREQQKKIGTCEEQIKQLSSSHKKIAQKARNQMREIDLLKTKLQNYESIVNKLEARNQVLDDRVHDQEKTISSQSAELDELRPQVEGKEELVKLIVDAQNILGKDKIRV